MSEYIATEFDLASTEFLSEYKEIVRCRDCVHGIKADLSGNWYECMKPDGNGDYARWEVESDGFCAWACRKSE